MAGGVGLSVPPGRRLTRPGSLSRPAGTTVAHFSHYYQGEKLFILKFMYIFRIFMNNHNLNVCDK